METRLENDSLRYNDLFRSTGKREKKGGQGRVEQGEKGRKEIGRHQYHSWKKKDNEGLDLPSSSSAEYG